MQEALTPASPRGGLTRPQEISGEPATGARGNRHLTCRLSRLRGWDSNPQPTDNSPLRRCA
jgi:hypothetical protein